MDKIYEFTIDIVFVSQILILLFIVSSLSMSFRRLIQRKWFFLLLFFLFMAILNGFALRFINPSIPNLFPIFLLGIGPSFYFHIKNETVSRKFLFHLIPMVPVLFLSLNVTPNLVKFWLANLVIAQVGFYLLLSIQSLSNKKLMILSPSMKDGTPIKNWTNNFYLLIVFIFVYLAVIIESYFIENKMIFKVTYVIIFIGISFLILRNIFLKGVTIYRLAQRNAATRKMEKYKDSILSPLKSSELAMKVEDIMSKTKPFLDDELDLKTLAHLTNLHPKSLSQVINENFQKNFFDYVNVYRIEVAKKMFENPTYSEYKIYEVMYEVGFNSRSSFNTAFKKFTGQTAKEFRDSLKA